MRIIAQMHVLILFAKCQTEDKISRLHDGNSKRDFVIYISHLVLIGQRNKVAKVD